MPPGVSLSDFYYILPELVLTGGALLVLIADVLLPKDKRAALAWVTLAANAAQIFPPPRNGWFATNTPWRIRISPMNPFSVGSPIDDIVMIRKIAA